MNDRGRLTRAVNNDTTAFMSFLGMFAAGLLAGLITVLVLDLEGRLRAALVVACALPLAGLVALMVWVARNPLDDPPG